jgi:hypothetical protein
MRLIRLSFGPLASLLARSRPLRVCKAHNDEIAAIRSQVRKAVNLVKKFHESTPNCPCEVCAFKQQLLSALKLKHLTCQF